jgi:CRISPR-associated protein Csm1
MIELYPWDKDLDTKSFYYVNNFHAGNPLMNLPYVAPKDEEENLLTFEEIAERSNGVKKLAMFKADIDNLGLIFSQSLGKRMSFSRYADLSHLLHYFFSSFYAWFVKNHKDQNGDSYENKIYTVFSGGDDLCVLGAWDSVLQFALDFQKELKKFTNNNPSVTISSGIVLSSSNVPVRAIAESAEENLEKSKSYSNGKNQKNAITLFGTTVSWEEYEKCLEDGKLLESLLENKKLSTGVIYKFLDFANRAEKTLGKKEGQDGVADVSELINPKDRIWKSNLIYIISRNVKDSEIKAKLTKFGESPDSMINSRIAVSYALYRQRI